MNTVRREIVLPASPDHVWEAITSPEVLREWFGAEVAWELTPGGSGSFHGDDGSRRRGRVGSVEPGRHLGFRWWPEGHEDEASDVDYDLSEEDDGTRLVVTESPAGASEVTVSNAQLLIGGSDERWTESDSRVFRVWAAASISARV
jgi:uncharacterized protein YndB with AHSA1/START domain